MVACPKCVVNNTLDSTFCKKCGVILPISMIEEEQEKLKEIVAKGMESFQTGNLEEAMAVAEHSILTNPSYGEAYALKGLVHERKGQYAEALDAYESVVALNPDSTMDKIKLNQLRNAFATRQAGDPKIDRKGAALLAFGVTLAVAAIGGISYGIMTSSKENKLNLASNAPVQSNQNLLANRSNTNQQTQTGVNPNPNQKNNDPGNVPALGPDNNPVANTGVQTENSSHRNSRGDRTVPAGIEGSVDGGFGNGGAIDPNPNKHLPGAQPANGNGNTGGGSKPSQGGGSIDPAPNPVNVGDKTDPPPTANTGIMEVTISHKGNEGSGGKGSESSSNGKSFQRQGQTAQRNGKTAQAREAYQKAIDAYQKDIDSGKGDKDAAQAGINSSKQALKNLKD